MPVVSKQASPGLSLVSCHPTTLKPSVLLIMPHYMSEHVLNRKPPRLSLAGADGKPIPLLASAAAKVIGTLAWRVAGSGDEIGLRCVGKRSCDSERRQCGGNE